MGTAYSAYVIRSRNAFSCVRQAAKLYSVTYSFIQGVQLKLPKVFLKRIRFSFYWAIFYLFNTRFFRSKVLKPIPVWELQGWNCTQCVLSEDAILFLLKPSVGLCRTPRDYFEPNVLVVLSLRAMS